MASYEIERGIYHMSVAISLSHIHVPYIEPSNSY